MNGWVKLHRGLLDWEWYTCPNTCRLFIHCLLKANHKDASFRGTKVERGSFLTSLEKLSGESGLSVQSTRTALANLLSTGEINKQSTRKGTKLSICNYDTYQSSEETGNTPANSKTTHQLTADQQTANKRSTTNKKEKNKKNKKNEEEVKEKAVIETVLTFDVFWDFYDYKKGTANAKQAWKKVTEADKQMILDTLRSYLASTEKEGKKYRKLAATYLNQRIWLDGEVEGFESGKTNEGSSPLRIMNAGVIKNG